MKGPLDVIAAAIVVFIGSVITGLIVLAVVRIFGWASGFSPDAETVFNVSVTFAGIGGVLSCCGVVAVAPEGGRR